MFGESEQEILIQVRIGDAHHKVDHRCSVVLLVSSSCSSWFALDSLIAYGTFHDGKISVPVRSEQICRAKSKVCDRYKLHMPF